MLRIKAFSAHYAPLYTEKSMRSISTINPAIKENTKRSIVKVRALFTNLKVGISLDHGILLRFISLLAVQACLAAF